MLGLALAALLVLPAGPAVADDDHPSWRIAGYDVTATVAAQGGVADVQLDLAFDFGSDPGRGPYLTMPLRQEDGRDPDRWRLLGVVVSGVTSPTGANTEVQTQEEDGNLLIRIGNENQFFTGVQRYRIGLAVSGLVAPADETTSGMDEFNWSVVGPGWTVPIDQVTASITGPADVERTACFTGGGYTDPCDSAASTGPTATFAQSRLEAEQPLQIVAGFPAGTFRGAESQYAKRYHPGNMFPVTPVTGGITGILTVLGLGWLFRRTRRGGRDRAHAPESTPRLPKGSSDHHYIPPSARRSGRARRPSHRPGRRSAHRQATHPPARRRAGREPRGNGRERRRVQPLPRARGRAVRPRPHFRPHHLRLRARLAHSSPRSVRQSGHRPFRRRRAARANASVRPSPIARRFPRRVPDPVSAKPA